MNYKTRYDQARQTASVVIGKYLYPDENAIEGQPRAIPAGLSPAGQRGEPLNAATLLRGKIAPVCVEVLTDHHTRLQEGTEDIEFEHVI